MRSLWKHQGRASSQRCKAVVAVCTRCISALLLSDTGGLSTTASLALCRG